MLITLDLRRSIENTFFEKKKHRIPKDADHVGPAPHKLQCWSVGLVPDFSNLIDLVPKLALNGLSDPLINALLLLLLLLAIDQRIVTIYYYYYYFYY